MKRARSVLYYLAGSISLITFAVFLASLQNQFLNWDDGTYVVGNPHIRSMNLSFFRWAFFEFYTANWHPLTWISHAIDYAVWGLNPVGHHLTNVILHAFNTFLAVMLVARLVEARSIAPRPTPRPSEERGIVKPTLEKKEGSEERTTPSRRGEEGKGGKDNAAITMQDSRFTLIAAGFTGLLFGLHPLHVESVAWVAERKDLLCAFFFFLSITSYTKYVSALTNEPAGESFRSPLFNRHYLLTIGFFVLALLSKPMAVSLPAVLLILDWYPFKRVQSLRTFRIACTEKLPFIALSLASSVVTILAQHTAGAMASLEVRPLPSRVLVAIQSLLAYLSKMLVPLNLIPYYSYPRDVSALSPEFFVPIVLVAGITSISVVLAKKRELWLAVWSYYVITLLPVIGIVQVGAQAMADRYTYLPSVAPFLLAGLLVAGIYQRAVAKWGPPVKIWGGAAAVALFAVLSYSTVTQIGVWKNSVTLWNYTVRKEPSSHPIVYRSLGLALIDEGRIDEAIANFQIALSKSPYYVKAHSGLGLAYEKAGRLEEAIEQYQIAVNLAPDDAKAHYTLGLALFHKGSMQKAIDQLDASLKLNPDDAEVQYIAGCVYGEAGLMDKAITHLQRAVRMEPSHAFAHYNLGVAYRGKGQWDNAITHLETAVRLMPSDAGFRRELAKTHALRNMAH